MHFRATVVTLLFVSSGCIDLEAYLKSSDLDVATWSAGPCPDVDGDGIFDVVLHAVVEPGASTSIEDYRAWILSGSTLEPICSLAASDGPGSLGVVAVAAHRDHDGDGVADLIAAVHRLDDLYPKVGFDSGFVVSARAAAVIGGREPLDSAWLGELSERMALRTWMCLALLDRNRPEWAGWVQSSEEGVEAVELATIPDASRRSEVQAARPDLSSPEPCGDLDHDGVLDWLGLEESPAGVVVLSGADSSVLRTIPMDSHPMATVVAGGFELDDVDGDGVRDWIIGAHVSQSAARVMPRACALGLIALVSGADWHVIRSVDRESFLAGAGASCPVVTLPD